MKKNNFKIFLIIFVFASIFSFFPAVNASCTTDSWYQCSGSYSVHYFINSDCSTDSNSIYCSNGCSGGYCQSAPTQTSTYHPTYNPPSYPSYVQTYNYPTYVYRTYYPTYTHYVSSGCQAQFLNNYQCSGNVQQQQFQNSDCSTTWRNVMTCAGTCSNGQCVSIVTPQTCPIQNLGAYRCSGSTQQVQYQYADCSMQWINQANCPNGCSNGQCVSPSCTDQNLNSYQCSGNYQQVLHQNSDCTTVWQNYQSCPNGCSNNQCMSQNYPTGYQILSYQYQYLTNPCSAGITNSYQCSGNVRQVQYQNSNCATSWQNVETCPDGCANGVCTVAAIKTITTTITQPYYFSNLWIIVLIFAIIVLFVIVIKLFVQDNPRRDYRNQPE